LPVRNKGARFPWFDLNQKLQVRVRNITAGRGDALRRPGGSVS
jgi:hypothetical protein